MMMYRPIRNSLLVCCALLIGCHSDKARQKADFTENDATAVVRNLLRSEGADLAGIEISAKRDPDGGWLVGADWFVRNEKGEKLFAPGADELFVLDQDGKVVDRIPGM